MADGWWNLDGAITSCVAAYQPIGAASYAASLADLSGNNNNATEGNAPTFDSSYGWSFDGVNDYLYSIGVGLAVSNATLIIRFSEASRSANYMTGIFGEYSDIGARCLYLSTYSTFWNSWLVISGSLNPTSGVMAINSEYGFLNGTAVTTKQTPGNNTTERIIAIGGITAKSGINKTACKVQACAIYNTSLTPTQIGLLTTAMASLTGATADSLTAADLTLNPVTFDAPTLANVVVTPACRTYATEAESRTYAIEAESRGLKISCNSVTVYAPEHVYSPLTGLDFTLNAPVFDSPTALPYTCLLKDEFTTAESAPIASPRSCEPIGTLAITDPNNKVTVSGGKLIYSYAGINAIPSAVSDTYSLTPGKTLMFKLKSARAYCGWYTTYEKGVITIADYFIWINDNSSIKKIAAADSNVTYECVITKTGSGIYYWIKGGVFSTQQLVWVGSDATTVDVATKFIGAAGKNLELSDVIVYESGGDWTTLYNKLQSAISAAAGNVVTHPVNALIRCSYTAPAGDANIYFRYANDDNTWILRTKAGNYIKLIEKNGGVETERGSWSGSPSTETFIGLDGDRIWVNCGYIAFLTYTSAFNQTATVLKSDVALTGIICDIYLAPPAMITGLPLERFTTYGDSKGTQQWQPVLQLLTEPVSHRGLYNTGGYNHAGDEVDDLKAVIDGNLAAATHTPEYVLVNTGANDVLHGNTNWTQMIADYGYILDAIHAKWADCMLKVAKIWTRNAVSDQDYFDDVVIPTVLSTRPWASVGMDERIVIKADDDGATYTTDGTHYSTAGLTVVANAWKSAIGY